MEMPRVEDNFQELVFIIDCSGSMSGLEEATIDGYNNFLKKQRTSQEEVLVSTVFFNSDMELVQDRVPIDEVNYLQVRDYYPTGCTALYDAVGETINHIMDKTRGKLGGKRRGNKTICVIITDGMENASREFRLQDIKRLIKKQRRSYKWEFVFLGANIEAEDVAEDLGIGKEMGFNFRADEQGVERTFEALGEVVYACIEENEDLAELAEQSKLGDLDRD